MDNSKFLSSVMLVGLLLVQAPGVQCGPLDSTWQWATKVVKSFWVPEDTKRVLVDLQKNAKYLAAFGGVSTAALMYFNYKKHRAEQEYAAAERDLLKRAKKRYDKVKEEVATSRAYDFLDFIHLFDLFKKELEDPLENRIPVIREFKFFGFCLKFTYSNFSRNLLVLNSLANKDKKEQIVGILDAFYSKRKDFAFTDKNKVGSFYQESLSRGSFYNLYKKKTEKILEFVPIEPRPFYEELLRIDTKAQETAGQEKKKEIAE